MRVLRVVLVIEDDVLLHQISIGKSKFFRDI